MNASANQDDIEFWRNEVRSQLLSIKQLLHNLRQRKSKLSHVIEDLNASLAIVLTCLNHRTARVDIDIISDDINEELAKEKNQLLRMKSSLENFIFEIISLLYRGTSIKQRLEKDITFKINPFLRAKTFAHRQPDAPGKRPISSFNCSETELRQSIALGLEFSKNAGDLFSAIANYSADANRTLSRQKMTVEEVLQKKLKGHKEHLIELKKSYGNVLDQLSELEIGGEYNLEVLEGFVSDNEEINLEHLFKVEEAKSRAQSARLSEANDLIKKRMLLEKEIKVTRVTIQIDEEVCIPVHNLSEKQDLTNAVDGEA